MNAKWILLFILYIAPFFATATVIKSEFAVTAYGLVFRIKEEITSNNPMIPPSWNIYDSEGQNFLCPLFVTHYNPTAGEIFGNIIINQSATASACSWVFDSGHATAIAHATAQVTVSIPVFVEFHMLSGMASEYQHSYHYRQYIHQIAILLYSLHGLPK